MNIRVKVNTTKKDYYSFQKKHVLSYLWVYVLFVILIGLIAFVLVKTYDNTGELNQLYLIIGIIAAGAFIFVLVNNITKQRKAAAKEESKKEFVYTFSKGGIHCESSGKSFDLTWDRIYKVTQTDDLFLIYISSESAFIIPKRFFANESEIRYFSENYVFKARKNVRRVKKGGIL